MTSINISMIISNGTSMAGKQALRLSPEGNAHKHRRNEIYFSLQHTRPGLAVVAYVGFVVVAGALVAATTRLIMAARDMARTSRTTAQRISISLERIDGVPPKLAQRNVEPLRELL